MAELLKEAVRGYEASEEKQMTEEEIDAAEDDEE